MRVYCGDNCNRPPNSGAIGLLDKSSPRAKHDSSVRSDRVPRHLGSDAAPALASTGKSPGQRLFSTLASWRRALLLFLSAGLAGWMAIAALIYGSTIAWQLIAGDNTVTLQVAPAAGPLQNRK